MGQEFDKFFHVFFCGVYGHKPFFSFGDKQPNFDYSFFFEAAARTTVAKIRAKSTMPKTVSGILKAGSECRTVVEGFINIPPR